MPEYMISGIPVNFPFEPYSVQSAYMEKVLECLKKVYRCVPYDVHLPVLTLCAVSFKHDKLDSEFCPLSVHSKTIINMD